jgi:methionyl-tRNA formyltransferase
MRIVFMGTPDFASASLTAVLAAGHEVVGVFCQPDKPKGRSLDPQPPPVKCCAAAAGNLPVHQPRRIGPKTLALLSQMAPDVIVVAAYGKLLPPPVLALPRFGCLNVHASLLPKYRGPAPIQWTIADGHHITGVTLMQMAETLDTGDILLQRKAPIREDDTGETLHDRLAALGAELLVDALAKLERRELHPVPQDESQATWAPMLTRDHGRIDWSWPARQIADRTRAFHPWPGAFTTFRGKLLKLFPFMAAARHADAWLHSGAMPEPRPAVAAGTILAVREKGLVVACGDGTVIVPEVKQEGKKQLPAAQFATGARLQPGERLE